MEQQTCYICGEPVNIKDLRLCKEHASDLNRHFESGFCLIKTPEAVNNCQICGEWENRIILNVPHYRPYCNICIEDAIKAYKMDTKTKLDTELKKEENILRWLQKWYALNCNGDWEHGYGVDIGTLDNPGWGVEINLKDTYWEGLVCEYVMIDNGDMDWYCYGAADAKYKGNGDPSKLEIILKTFKRLVEEFTAKE